MAKRNVTDGQDIYHYIRRKIYKPFLLILIVGYILIGFAVFIDLSAKVRKDIYKYISKFLQRCGSVWYECGRYLKLAISENIEDFYNMLITITTILAATVIFFYSVQDNKKDGIPHRAILAYSFGSYTIPLFFLSSMFILPVGFWMFHFNMKVTFVACAVVSYVLQMTIIVLILFSTSYSYGLRVIRNAEIRQYKKLCDIKNENSSNLNGNPLFIWTYLLHHLEQVVTSDELIADKMMLIRELLKAPFYSKEISLLRKQAKKDDDTVDGMSKDCLINNDLSRIYEFYYGNLSAVMEYLRKTENSSERNKVYLILYEFLDNLYKLYCKVYPSKQTQASSKAMKNYMMVVSALLNAIMDSGTSDIEGFCNYVLNECIIDKEIRMKQIGLYFLFHEYLYHTYIEGKDDYNLMPVQHYARIRDIAKWSMRSEDEELYYDFWRIWMAWTTVSEINSLNIFKNAITALEGKGYNYSLVSHIMLSIRRTGRDTYEDKGDSAYK